MQSDELPKGWQSLRQMFGLMLGVQLAKTPCPGFKLIAFRRGADGLEILTEGAEGELKDWLDTSARVLKNLAAATDPNGEGGSNLSVLRQLIAMDEKTNWRGALRAAYPGTFDDLDFGIECGDGWREVLFDLFSRIAEILKPYPAAKIHVSQVKEKFGELRVYASVWTDDEAGLPDEVHTAVYNLIERAEARSRHICETCGARGAMRCDGGWYFTACDDHSKGVPAEKNSGWIYGTGDDAKVYDFDQDAFVPYKKPERSEP